MEKESRIICGHALDILSDFLDETFQTCVTSPPYWGKRQYAGPQARVWGGGLDCEHDWEDQVVIHDALRNRGKNGVVGNDANPRIKPDTGNHTVSAFCRKCQAWRGALGQEPTPELYVQHLVTIGEEIKRVLRPDGTFWLNMGDSFASGKRDTKGVDLSRATNSKEASYVGGWHTQANRLYNGLPRKNLVGLPWLTAFAFQAAGWILRCDIIWEKPNGKPEPVKDRPTITHEYLFLFSKSEKYFYDVDAIREPHQTKPK